MVTRNPRETPDGYVAGTTTPIIRMPAAQKQQLAEDIADSQAGTGDDADASQSDDWDLRDY